MGKPPAASRDLRKAQGSGLSIPRKKRPFEAQGRELSHTPAELALPDQNLSALDGNLPEPDDFLPAPWEVDGSNPLNWTCHAGNAPLTAVDIFDQDHDLMSHSATQQFMQFGSTDPGLVCDDGYVRSISTSFHNLSNNGPRGSADALFLPLTEPRPSDPRCDCTSLVSCTLRNLDVDRLVWDAASSAKNGRSTLTTDHILINNKVAIDHVYRFLGCSCSLNPRFSLTITLICYHIIERYEAIVGATPPTHCTSGSPTSCAANLLTTPITIGEYQIDEEDEQRMRIQLVVNELRKVRGLVDKYGERYCTGLDGDKERHEGIYSALEMFLKSKLKETVNYLVRTLQT